jgi:hypothetical protein
MRDIAVAFLKGFIGEVGLWKLSEVEFGDLERRGSLLLRLLGGVVPSH